MTAAGIFRSLQSFGSRRKKPSGSVHRRRIELTMGGHIGFGRLTFYVFWRSGVAGGDEMSVFPGEPLGPNCSLIQDSILSRTSR